MIGRALGSYDAPGGVVVDSLDEEVPSEGDGVDVGTSESAEPLPVPGSDGSFDPARATPTDSGDGIAPIASPPPPPQPDIETKMHTTVRLGMA